MINICLTKVFFVVVCLDEQRVAVGHH